MSLKTFRWHGSKAHFLDEVKDGDEIIIVFKIWRKSKQFWNYFAEPKWLIEHGLKEMEKYAKDEN